MFEHMRNYETLLARIASRLAPGATLFVHMCTHREYAWSFDSKPPANATKPTGWRDTSSQAASCPAMTCGCISSATCASCRTGGYPAGNSLTSEAWLQNMDHHRAELMPVLARTNGAAQARRWWVYWRVFFMSCAELWGYADGREWLVSHYLFERHSR